MVPQSFRALKSFETLRFADTLDQWLMSLVFRCWRLDAFGTIMIPPNKFQNKRNINIWHPGVSCLIMVYPILNGQKLGHPDISHLQYIYIHLY
jgi:hypothetical protein